MITPRDGDQVTALTEEQVLAQIREFVQREFLYMRPGVVLSDDDSLMKSGVVDSMGVLEVMQFLSDTFDVSPSDEEITEENLGSLRFIARFVLRKLSLQAPGPSLQPVSGSSVLSPTPLPLPPAAVRTSSP